MSLKLVQLSAIIRCEVYMQWRRRLLPVVMVGLLVSLLLVGLIVRDDARQRIVDDMSPEIQMEAVSHSVVQVFMSVLVLIGNVFPVIVADAIPRDRQFGVRQLLSSLPLTPGVYLVGKVFSVWVGIIGGILGVLAVTGAVYWFLVGAFDVGYVLANTWLWAAFVLYTTAMITLLAAGQPTRRRAALIGVVFVFVLSVNALSLTGGASDVFLARQTVFWLNAGVLGAASPFSQTDVLLTVAFMVVHVAIVWTLVWWWMRREYTGGLGKR